jgi:hypothetical protein
MHPSFCLLQEPTGAGPQAFLRTYPDGTRDIIKGPFKSELDAAAACARYTAANRMLPGSAVEAAVHHTFGPAMQQCNTVRLGWFLVMPLVLRDATEQPAMSRTKAGEPMATFASLPNTAAKFNALLDAADASDPLWRDLVRCAAVRVVAEAGDSALRNFVPTPDGAPLSLTQIDMEKTFQPHHADGPLVTMLFPRLAQRYHAKAREALQWGRRELLEMIGETPENDAAALLRTKLVRFTTDSDASVVATAPASKRPPEMPATVYNSVSSAAKVARTNRQFARPLTEIEAEFPTWALSVEQTRALPDADSMCSVFTVAALGALHWGATDLGGGKRPRPSIKAFATSVATFLLEEVAPAYLASVAVPVLAALDRIDQTMASTKDAAHPRVVNDVTEIFAWLSAAPCDRAISMASALAPLAAYYEHGFLREIMDVQNFDKITLGSAKKKLRALGAPAWLERIVTWNSGGNGILWALAAAVLLGRVDAVPVVAPAAQTRTVKLFDASAPPAAALRQYRGDSSGITSANGVELTLSQIKSILQKAPRYGVAVHDVEVPAVTNTALVAVDSAFIDHHVAGCTDVKAGYVERFWTRGMRTRHPAESARELQVRRCGSVAVPLYREALRAYYAAASIGKGSSSTIRAQPDRVAALM